MNTKTMRILWILYVAMVLLVAACGGQEYQYLTDEDQPVADTQSQQLAEERGTVAAQPSTSWHRQAKVHALRGVAWGKHAFGWLLLAIISPFLPWIIVMMIPGRKERRVEALLMVLGGVGAITLSSIGKMDLGVWLAWCFFMPAFIFMLKKRESGKLGWLTFTTAVYVVGLLYFGLAYPLYQWIGA